MSDDLVRRLKSCAKDCTMLGDEADAAFFNEAALALTEARAEIERLNARIDSFTEDRVFHESQASKLRRLEDLVRDGAARATALESELSTLRARVREVVGPFARINAFEVAFSEHGKTYRLDYNAAFADQLAFRHFRAAHQLMEEVK